MSDLSSIRKLSAEARAYSEQGSGFLENLADAQATLANCANLLDRLTDEGALERMARAIYEQNPLYGPVDLDGRPTHPAGAIPWSSLYESDAGLYANSMDQAREALNALLAEDGQ